MKLNEFIQSALTDILTGIRDAQANQDIGAFIVPTRIGGHEFAKHPRVSSAASLASTVVDFDVAVTVEENSAMGGEGGLKIAGFGLKGSGSSGTKDVTVSRLQFAVPILLPRSTEDWSASEKRTKGADGVTA